jgi:carbonic anhydrase
MKNENKLFLICPDCYVENRIRNNFSGQLYFATALGAVFTPIKFNYAESLNGLINREEVREIYIVNDISCRFINSIITNSEGFNTKEENILRKIYLDNADQIAKHEEQKLKSIELAKLNINQQIEELKKTEFIGAKYDAGHIKIKGLLYDRHTLEFKELNMKPTSYESAK